MEKFHKTGQNDSPLSADNYFYKRKPELIQVTVFLRNSLVLYKERFFDTQNKAEP